MKNNFRCQDCQKIFKAVGKRVKYRDPFFGICWERIAKCPVCDSECREYRQKSSSKKKVDFDSYVNNLKNRGGGGCNPGGGCCE